ncbi:hypothetical protein GCM10011591_12800 [Nocardia camponoti]|uniref:Uncharacterized protein n=2 Tax=Nocardia camponoti TaxID=1616106 RepID=A0A917QBZ9_9NOCA|nr:hypothetical protein GCM10011591_12800 [Nocardia camponoti]
MLGQCLPERILGALELLVADLAVPAAPNVVALLPKPQDDRAVMFSYIAGGSEITSAVDRLMRLRPGAVELVSAMTARFSEHPDVVTQLRSTQTSGRSLDEAGVAAEHGGAYLALGVAVAAIVLRSLGECDDPTRVIGAGLIAACPLLREAPMPAAYAAAHLAKVREQYLYPRYSSGTVRAIDHQFALTETEFLATADFSENGLVAVVPGGIAVRTGRPDGIVSVRVVVFDKPPVDIESVHWDEVVEVSWTADRGLASVIGAIPSPGHGGFGSMDEQTPPWAGTYRVRVHATGRDDAHGQESYQLTVWQAPLAETQVHKRTDRLGHLLRGEAEPVPVANPEDAYRWVEQSAISEAATITLVAISDLDTVLRAFGADPALPQKIDALEERAMSGGDPWVTVVPLNNAVLAVEDNGFRGSQMPELEALSRGTRVASLFWNVNGVTQLSFATEGRVIAAFELGEPQHDPALGPVLSGLDFDDYRHRIAKGLVALERFTGVAFGKSDFARMGATGVGFAIPS